MAELRGRDLTKIFPDGTRALDGVSFVARPGRVLTLLGPSGCGKSTLLRIVAGLEQPNSGTLELDGARLDDVPAGRRGAGLVFQNYALYPHLTVAGNLSLALEAARVPRPEIEARVRETAELLGIADLVGRRPGQLSGGQQQRVALGRALVRKPRFYLLDEPLSNLDAKLREQMRVELVRLQHEVGITSIYVTHDQAEALVMSDRVVVMNGGSIQQVADPYTIYTRPANSFVAKFIGVANLLEGTVLGRSGESWELEIPIGAEHAPLRLRADGGNGFVQGAAAFLCVRPEDIRLHTARPDNADGYNVIEADVIDTVYLGTFLECRVRVGPYEVCVQTDHLKPLARGEKVFLAIEPDHALCLAD